MSQTKNKNTIFILAFIVTVVAIAGYSNHLKQDQTPKPSIIAEASFEDLRSEKQKELDDLKKQDEINKLKKESKETEIKNLEIQSKIDELETGLKGKGLENQTSPQNPVKAIMTAVSNIVKQDDPTEIPKSEWTPFVEFAKQNPWRGKTFPEGNHLQIAKANQSKYEGIAGCHPLLLMAIHYTETGLQFNNGANAQGAFQAYSSGIRYEPNSPTTDFDVQAKRACDHIRGKVGGADLSNIEDTNLIGKALALYNGCYSPALGIYARGDFESPDGWDKCPYTANFLQSNEPMTQCATDGCRSTNKRQIYGTMAFIAYLKI
jgi:hypothetical protein